MLTEKEKLAAKLSPIIRMSADTSGKKTVFYAGDDPVYEGVCGELERKGVGLVVDAKDSAAVDGRIRVVYLRNAGLFVIGDDPASARGLAGIIVGRSESFTAPEPKGRMARRIVVVTGAAQGFGRAIAEGFADEGAYVVVADLNIDGARRASDEINKRHGYVSVAMKVDVSDEESVSELCGRAVLEFGGIDVFISCAGIVKAGGLSELSSADFELVTKVNYSGFYYCTKYASEVMWLENSVSPEYFTDIIEINSKSGLSGSLKNFAYAGSKFGGIGLVESFALELAGQRTKVNAVCPGNYLDGKLWSDPENGLFVQYLRAGKVEGARNVDDVRRYYESKVPLGRGCRPVDVIRAVFYLVEQEYETGQALPVTGGQAMLK